MYDSEGPDPPDIDVQGGGDEVGITPPNNLRGGGNTPPQKNKNL